MAGKQRDVRIAANARVALCVSSPRLVHPERIVSGCLRGFRVTRLEEHELAREIARQDSLRPSLVVSIEETDAVEGAFTISSSTVEGVPRVRIAGGGVPGAIYGTNDAFGRRIRRRRRGPFLRAFECL